MQILCLCSSDSHELTLDPNTLNKCLCLSEENRMITMTETGQQYPDHPDRFDSLLQGLCRESVCGRSYWEVDWSGGVCISVSYKSISRKGEIDESGFGFNDHSWGLSCSSKRLSFWHKNEWTDYSLESSYCRIGVYVDHRAGILSFYSISDTMTLIHSIHTTFAQPLYPGFRLSLGGKATLCGLII
ncbi:putative E3 ubiquitin/ISG15 ligase TRIM25 [Triplophysa rosa]|uniref:E3 ubiquitin/ISG15 ligase TRIM25 n=1 Tax=Triplophysa rosa TaxID=992332 RepID=A0A9W7T428_TRIRA|nr:putative E3 ubiquitin/ISG15 ligase TRIM25 [Triplophysa rosa]